MKDRPILFSAPMVRALLDGSKTQTRRVVKPQPDSRPGMNCTRLIFKDRKGKPLLDEALEATEPVLYRSLCPYGQPGDRLWVRESLGYDAEYGHFYAAKAPGSLGNASGRTYLCSLFDTDEVKTYSEDPLMPNRSVPSIHLPRRYSRITLEVTGVRVERLQDISEGDGMAEGAFVWAGEQDTPVRNLPEARLGYRQLWEAINGNGSWDLNPWVWVVEFRVLPRGGVSPLLPKGGE